MMNTKIKTVIIILIFVVLTMLTFKYYIVKQDQLDMKELERLVEEEITAGILLL
jgi:preprotein translocase subunit YajC